MNPPRSRWERALLALLFIHVLWGVARVPSKVWGKRLREISAFEAGGDARFHLDNEHRQGADEIEFVRSRTPTDSIVLWRGQWRGAFEFATALLAPRLLVEERFCPPDAVALRGRQLARARLDDGREGVLVLVGHGDDLELVIR